VSLPGKLNDRGNATRPGLVDIEILEAEVGRLASRHDLREEVLAPNGYLGAATVIVLAYTSCGYGCLVNLFQNAECFATVELKGDFPGHRRHGRLRVQGNFTHSGSTTQTREVVVTHVDTGKKLAQSCCTPIILYPCGSSSG
jgi:1,4-dihydroxy-2-naphthoyl-CoA hydrolase